MRARPTQPPRPIDHLVGRDADLDALDAEVARSRLVTVLGPPGIGKTRLANELIYRLLARERAVAHCELTECMSEHDIVVRVATALGVATTAVEEQLAALPLVLVIDNAEHVAGEVGRCVERWLPAAQQLRVVVTTRTRLQLPGEVVFDLAPLDERAGMQLFVERARAARRDLGGSDEPAVRELVRLREGMPLAIELAAARSRMYEPAQLVAKLEQSAAPFRGESLAAALRLSYTLLSLIERRALAQASVFRGGFTIEAAEAVIDLDGASVIDALEALVDHSLLYTRRVGTRRRLGLYLVVREFAAAELAPDVLAAVQARHTEYFLKAGAGWLADIVGSNGPGAITAIAADADNLLAVHRRAMVEPGGGGRALDVALVLDPLLVSRGPIDHDLAILDQSLAAAPPDYPHRLAALESRANAMRYVRLDEAHASYEELEREARAAGDRRMQGRGLSGKGVVKLLLRDIAGEVDVQAALVIQREIGDKFGESISEASLGHLALFRCDLAVAREHFGRALALTVEIRDPRNEAFQQSNLGLVEQECGRLLVARTAFERSIDVFRSMADRRSEAWAMMNLGRVAQEQGNLDEARAIFEDALRQQEEVGSRRQMGIVLGHLGFIDQFEGAFERAHERYRQSLNALAASKVTTQRTLVGGLLASVLADLGVHDAARRGFDQAEVELRAIADLTGLAALEVSRGHLDLALGDVEAARRRLVEGLANIDRWSVRFARIGLERALERHGSTAPAPAQTAVAIGPQALWFRSADGPRVDLSRRRQLRRILLALATERRERPGRPLTIDALLASGWPDETVLPEAGASRVYVAISTLRRMGLRDVLLRAGDGYLFAPQAEIVTEA
jgi:predicted ATPase